ncbi:MAG TPA: tRNA adenosine(34) deaminase TadA [Phycisphaerae bacterium]|nr:tRNA adenosine(34) deaminase TadA [Phycisphaerae bacterium]HPS53265.1 tRNA adenosine(34) deaminase TadA [Phycisphaerae bacterium]
MNLSDAEKYERLMRLALEQAKEALKYDEVPIGAVIERNGEIIASAFNRRIIDADPTGHAEMIAIRQAAGKLGDWRLEGCTLAVTLEPCCMCAGAIVLARIPTLVYGAADAKGGAVDTLYNICNDGRLNHSVQVIGGVLADDAGRLLSDFFRRQREMGKK